VLVFEMVGVGKNHKVLVNPNQKPNHNHKRVYNIFQPPMHCHLFLCHYKDYNNLILKIHKSLH
jgi:hypothetical protein